MPATMTHLLTAHAACANAPVHYYTGAIAPDAVGPREVKDHTHLRDLPAEKRLDTLRTLARQWGMDDPFARGCVLHLFTDYYWDMGPLAEFIRTWPDENWFLPYRAALSESGIWLFHQTPWAAELLQKIYADPPAPHSLLCSVTLESLQRFLGHTQQWFAAAPQTPPTVFPQEEVLEFCRQTAAAWKIWSADL